MTIQRKILGGYLGLAVLIIALVAMGVSLLVWLNSWRTDSSVTVTHVKYANQFVVGETGMLNYVLLPLFDSFGENLSGYQSELQRYEAMAKDALTIVTKSENEPKVIASLKNIGDLFTKYEQGVSDVMTLQKTFPAQAGVKASSEVLPLARQLDQAAESYRQDQEAELASAYKGLTSHSKLMTIGMLILAFVAIASAIVIAVLLARAIARQLRAAVGGISLSASELLAVASQVAASAAQTAASATETTATVEEVKQTALLAHEKASQVAESSQDLATAAEAGQTTMNDTLAGFDRIATQMGVMSETMERLGEQAQAVGDIITTVNDLAEQSNLLSVNASIEAAKAGDQGRGFTVVAQEVKTLAEQSKHAVAQVRSILNEIQRANSVAVDAAERGRETVATSRQQSLASGQSVLRFVETAAEAAQSAAQISASSRQQLAGMEQISQAIESINQAGIQSAAGTRQVEQEVKQLQDLALKLDRMVNAAATA